MILQLVNSFWGRWMQFAICAIRSSRNSQLRSSNEVISLSSSLTKGILNGSAWAIGINSQYDRCGRSRMRSFSPLTTCCRVLIDTNFETRAVKGTSSLLLISSCLVDFEVFNGAYLTDFLPTNSASRLCVNRRAAIRCCDFDVYHKLEILFISGLSKLVMLLVILLNIHKYVLVPFLIYHGANLTR